MLGLRALKVVLLCLGAARRLGPLLHHPGVAVALRAPLPLRVVLYHLRVVLLHLGVLRGLTAFCRLREQEVELGSIQEQGEELD